MRLGLLGGSFDPVHYGHLLLAECCREACALDEVWFVPAATPPHKQSRSLASAGQRLEMLQLATGGAPAFRVCELEIQRKGVSYTVDTLEQIHREQPETELFLLLGADSLNDLPNWREPERICQLAQPVAVRRPNYPEPRFELLADLLSSRQLQNLQEQQVAMPLIELSSSDIRQRISAGQSIRFRTPRAVEKFIQAQRIYESESPSQR